MFVICPKLFKLTNYTNIKCAMAWNFKLMKQSFFIIKEFICRVNLKISKIVTGTPNDAIIPVELYLCGDCGEICEELLPKELKGNDKE